jgi:hypothetical protein
MNKTIVGTVVALGVVGVATGCNGSSQSNAQQQAQSKASHHRVYIPRNDLELQNYNDRQRLADDPTTIVWCTFYPPTPGSKAFTVPIAGKLTSSGKTPFPQSAPSTDNWTQDPGPDGMYGQSSEYRYGFDPTRGVYYDFTTLASFCTNEPTVYQSQQTAIVVKTDATLSSLDHAAQAALKSGNAKRAAAILASAGNGNG